MTNFKVGDKVIAIAKHSQEIPAGIGIIRSIEGNIDVEFPDWDGGHTCSGRCNPPHGWSYPIVDAERYLKLINAKSAKPQPEELHVVLVDSCKNFVGAYTSYKNAECSAKECSDDVTIYEITEIAKVSSIRQVKQVIVSKPKAKAKAKAKAIQKKK